MSEVRKPSHRILTAAVLNLFLLPGTVLALGQSGYWACARWSWTATTTERSMIGQTQFECGPGHCGDSSHTQPLSWVDIWGGISQSCEDHSTSFWGPWAGEWDGCRTLGTQVSTGVRAIEGINQSWDRLPTRWKSGYYYDEDISYFGVTQNMNQPFASVYDLDTCITGDIIGTIYWPNFPVTATLLGGDPSDPHGVGYAKWALQGSTGVSCSTKQSSCETVVCSDLVVSSTFECIWEVEEDDCLSNPEMNCPP